MSIPSGQRNLNITVTNAAITNASAQCLAASTTRFGLIFHNPNAAGNISIVPTSFGAAVSAGGGTLTLIPGASIQIDGLRTLDAFNAIASVAGPIPLTIWEF
jgi:hypothetical protein